MVVDEDLVARKFAAMSPFLDERQRRLWVGVEAREVGHGGISAVARAAGVSRPTVAKAVKELGQPAAGLPAGRVRRAGGGRKKASQTDPDLLAGLQRLVDPATRGDPESSLLWTSKSTRELAGALAEGEHQASHTLVGRLLKQLGYSLQAMAKTAEGKQHPDRDAQFRYLTAQSTRITMPASPSSVLTPKKGVGWGVQKTAVKSGSPKANRSLPTSMTSSAPRARRSPTGSMTSALTPAWVSVGTDHDTAAFAVATLRRWWQAMGQPTYPGADRLLVCADGGGSNGSRTRLWKVELAALAADTGLAITVCHLPPGTSKWNKIEHRLFSHISMNWRGRPLQSHQVVVQLIAATTTRTGLKVHAELDQDTYPKGIKVSDDQMRQLPLHRHSFHGDWNYTLNPE